MTTPRQFPFYVEYFGYRPAEKNQPAFFQLEKDTPPFGPAITELARKLVSPMDQSKPKVVFLFVRIAQLTEKDFFDAFAGWDKYRRHHPTQFTPPPIVTIGTEDIMDLAAEQWVRRLHLDLRYHFLDSSIWHYYLPFDNARQDNFAAALIDVLEQIEENYAHGLYFSGVAQEFIEFQTRLLVNATLKKSLGGHAGEVSPFLFHSESALRGLLHKKQEQSPLTAFRFSGYLIDDYADTPMQTPESNQLTVSKRALINTLTKQHLGQRLVGPAETPAAPGPAPGIAAPTGSLIDQAWNDLVLTPDKRYDIIFLDYLLAFNDRRNSREYGDAFFTKIEDMLKAAGDREAAEIRNSSPLGYFWIFPISSFSNAIVDKMRGSGIPRISEDWYVSDWADPVNTPRLFLYNLYSFMRIMAGKAGKDHLVTDGAHKENLYQFVSSLFEDESETPVKVKRHFRHIVELKNNFSRLENVRSAFSESTVKHIYGHISAEAFEELEFLLYMIGNDSYSSREQLYESLRKLYDLLAPVKDPYAGAREEIERCKGKTYMFKKIGDYIQHLPN